MNKSEIKKYIKETDFDVQNAYAAFWAVDIAFDAYAKSRRTHGSNFSPAFCYISYKKLSSFYQVISKQIVENTINNIYKKYKKDNAYLDKMITKQKNIASKIDTLWLQVKDLKKLSIKELLKIHDNFISISFKWWQYSAINEDKGAIIDRIIIPNYKTRNNIAQDKAREIISTLSHPDQPAIFNEARIKFLEICLLVKNKKQEEISKDKKINNLLKNYVRNFFWIKSDFYRALKITPASILQDANEELKNHSAKEINQELKKIKNNFSDLERKKKYLLKIIKLSEEDKEDLYFAKKIIGWVDQRKFEMMKDLYYLYQILEEISRRFNINYDIITKYTIEDTRKLLRTGEKPSQKKIDKIIEGVFIVYSENKAPKIFYGREADELLNLIIKKDQGENEIKGIVASKTKDKVVSGKVRIVPNPKDVNFQKGEILVTSMTRIEFVPLMRKAKAIITNEGGMACHAAIVSRELGLPAIIGTKNATKILRDGDLVEMDMVSGKIIKK